MKSRLKVRFVLSMLLVVIFSPPILARERTDPGVATNVFLYSLFQYVNGVIGELDLSANYHGSGEVYPMAGVGAMLRKRAVYTGFRADINPALLWQSGVPKGYLGWVLGYTGKIPLMGAYRVDLSYGIEPASETYVIEPRYVGQLPRIWSQGPQHRRDVLEWAVSYRYALREQQPADSSSIMFHILVSRYGSKSPVSF